MTSPPVVQPVKKFRRYSLDRVPFIKTMGTRAFSGIDISACLKIRGNGC